MTEVKGFTEVKIYHHLKTYPIQPAIYDIVQKYIRPPGSTIHFRPVCDKLKFENPNIWKITSQLVKKVFKKTKSFLIKLLSLISGVE